MSDPHLTPDELTAENDLICEKLLGWTREPGNRYTSGLPYWREHDSIRTPSFTTWAEAGLILDAFVENDLLVSIQFTGKGGFCAVNDVSADQKSGSLPLTIRAAALKYIKAVKS